MKLFKRAVGVILAVTMCFTLASCMISIEKSEQEDNSSQVIEPVTPAIDVSKVKTVTVPCYNLCYTHYSTNDPAFYTDPKPVSEYKTGDYRFCVVEGEEDLLYCSLPGYAALIAGDMKNDFNFSTTTEGLKSTYTVTYDGAENLDGIAKGVVYTATFDAENKKIYGNGAVGDVLKVGDVYANTIEEYSIVTTETVYAVNKNEYEFSFDGYGFDTFTYENEIYFPFSLLDFHFHRETQRYFVYSSYYNMMFEYSADEQLDVEFTLPEGVDFTGFASIGNVVNTGIKACYTQKVGEETKDVLPMHMREYFKSLFMFAMDNYYGLAETLGYKDMSDYFENTGYADDFLSEDPRARAVAYGTVVSLLNDMHTSLQGAAALGEGTGFAGSRYYQTFFDHSGYIGNLLRTTRDAELNKAGDKVVATDVRYSSDNKTAYFSFDEFSIAKYDSENPDLDKDTFRLFIKNLNEIKSHGRQEGAEKGTVENVVIDMSLNGGGYVYIMLKLLALLSKNNEAYIYVKNFGNVYKYCAKVDSNKDGVYDEKDCYGQYFNFYFITSPMSFSCGNAMPYYAQQLGIGQTMGGRTGGGECFVGVFKFPLGQTLYMSSLTHAGWYDEAAGGFVGSEQGAMPNIAYFGNYFSVDDVAAAIYKKQQQNAGNS